jgi:hypothetical protein
MKDDWGALISFAVFAFALGVLWVAFLMTPVFLVAGVPVVAYLYHRNSPRTKEKLARQRTEALYEQARAIAPPNVDAHADRLFDALDETTRDVAAAIYKLEGIDPPPPLPPICDSIEGARYRDRLIKYINTAHDQTVSDEFVDALIECMPRFPPSEGIFEATATLTGDEVERLIAPFYRHDDFFKSLKKTLDRNLTHQKDVMPSDYKGDNVTYAYLRDTPLLDLETRRFRIGLKARAEHTQVIAASGSGKTSLLQYLIHHDLDEDCCVIVIDSQKQLIDTLAKRAVWTDDIAYFSPRHNLGLNLFDMPVQGEQEINAVIDLLEYVFAGLMDAKLTTKQATLFNYATQLMMASKGNLSSLRRLLRKDGGVMPFATHIEKLPRSAQDFFLSEFSQKGYDSTKEEIMWRIDSMQRNPAFARIFDAPKNPVDMAYEMRNRDLILIDTDVGFLGETGSSFFGRLFIALILQAARQRVASGDVKRPVYLFIDECAAYLDARLETMMVQVRKANIGVTLAHQDLDQLRKAGILNTVLGGTATKFAGRLSDADARVMASNMRTSHEFLQNLPRYHFALSRLGEATADVSFNTWTYEKADKRTDYEGMVAEMERRYGYTPPPPAPEVAPPPLDRTAPAPRPAPRPKAPKPAPPVDEEIRPTNKL